MKDYVIRNDGKTTVELFYIEEDFSPFVCAVNGHITKEAIEEIAEQINSSYPNCAFAMHTSVTNEEELENVIRNYSKSTKD